MNNGVFISYRHHISRYTAMALFQSLSERNIETFVEVDDRAVNYSQEAILRQITKYPYFVIILAPTSLEDCAHTMDGLRIEIETAVESKRIIIPLLMPSFDFKSPLTLQFLEGDLLHLLEAKSIRVSLDSLQTTIDELHQNLLPLADPAFLPEASSLSDKELVQQHMQKALAQPKITANQLIAQKYLEIGLSRPEEDTASQLEDYTKAIQIDTQFAEAYFNRGVVHIYRAEYEQGIADLKHTLSLQPLHVRAHYHWGRALHALKDYQGAIDKFNQTIQIDSNFSYAYINRGNVYRDQRSTLKAIEDYTQAIAIDSRELMPFVNRGFARLEFGDFENAISDFSQAIAMNKRNGEPYYHRGVAYVMVKNTAKALDDFRKCVELCTNDIRFDSQDVWAYHTRGMAHVLLGNTKEACADYEQVLKLYPQHPDRQQMKSYIAKHSKSKWARFWGQ